MSLLKEILSSNKIALRFISLTSILMMLIVLGIYLVFHLVYSELYNTIGDIRIESNSLVINTKRDNKNYLAITTVPSGSNSFIKTGVKLKPNEKAIIKASGLVNLCIERTVSQIHDNGYPHYPPSSPLGNSFLSGLIKDSLKDNARKQLLLYSGDLIGQLVILLNSDENINAVEIRPKMNMDSTYKGKIFSYKEDDEKGKYFLLKNTTNKEVEVFLAVNDIMLSNASPELIKYSKYAFVGTDSINHSTTEPNQSYKIRFNQRRDRFEQVVRSQKDCFYRDNLGDFLVIIQKEGNHDGLFSW